MMDSPKLVAIGMKRFATRAGSAQVELIRSRAINFLKGIVMSQISVGEASGRLSELIKTTPAGEDIILLENDRPVARIVPMSKKHPQVKRGYAKGRVLYMAPDSDVTPEEIEDYI